MKQENSNSPTLISEITKSIVIVIITGVISYKVIITPFNMTMDAPTLLSLLLALFSVALSALFYFKATDTSNAFYDNTYKFTKEIAELLVKIESGFGEKLRHLDEGYNKIQDRFLPPVSKEEVFQAEEQVQEKQDELAEKLKDREKLIEELVNKAKLDDKEKQSFLSQLAARDTELRKAQKSLDVFRDEVNYLRSQSESSAGNLTVVEKVAINFFRQQFLDLFEDEKLMSEGFSTTEIYQKISQRWEKVIKHNQIPSSVVGWLIKRQFINPDDSLTMPGIAYIFQVCQETISRRKMLLKPENLDN